MTTLIDISKYTKRFESYPDDLAKFCEKNGVNLPGIDSLMGQAYALMAQPEVRGQKHAERVTATKFFTQIGKPTTDSIQQFNKARGLKRIEMRGKYCLSSRLNLT